MVAKVKWKSESMPTTLTAQLGLKDTTSISSIDGKADILRVLMGDLQSTPIAGGYNKCWCLAQGPTNKSRAHSPMGVYYSILQLVLEYTHSAGRILLFQG